MNLIKLGIDQMFCKWKLCFESRLQYAACMVLAEQAAVMHARVTLREQNLSEPVRHQE